MKKEGLENQAPDKKQSEELKQDKTEEAQNPEKKEDADMEDAMKEKSMNAEAQQEKEPEATLLPNEDADSAKHDEQQPSSKE